MRWVDMCDLRNGNIEKLTDEVLDFFLGNATNKQARINLYYECKYDSEVLKDVLSFYKETNCECGLSENGVWSEEIFDRYGCSCNS